MNSLSLPWRTAVRTHRAAVLMTALAVAPVVAPTMQAVQQDSGLVGITGHWTTSTTDDGVATITVDGTRWSGSTDSLDLARSSVRLFGGVDQTFVQNGRAPGAFPLAVAAGVRHFTSGTIRVRFRLVGGASDQNAGIVFGLQPNGEYLYLRYNTKDGDLALWRFANGARQSIAHGEARRQLPLGAWHVLEVTLRGRELLASVPTDSTLRFMHTLDTAPSGRVGLWVKRDAVTAFQQFEALPTAAR